MNRCDFHSYTKPDMTKFLRKFLKLTGILLIVMTAIYFAGPKPDTPHLDPVLAPSPYNIRTIDAQIKAAEKTIADIKTRNNATIWWADSIGIRTEYALVYLHGFSASRGEGDPIHLQLAKRYGMNAYLARLDKHGRAAEEPMVDLTPEGLLESAKRAIQVGETLGEKVIIVSCSTGGTLGLYLAAHNPEKIHALVCYSPNVDMYDKTSKLLDEPWGLQIARMAEGGKYHHWEGSDSVQHYWNTSYRIEALVALRQLVDATMTSETFAAIRQPLLVLYYYKNEDEKDDTVSLTAMSRMFDEVSTPPEAKRMLPVPGAGAHVISSKYVSGDLNMVWQYSQEFLEEVVNLYPTRVMLPD